MPKIDRFLDPYVVTSGKHFRLKDHDPANVGKGRLTKESAAGLLQQGIERLTQLQELLYADKRWSVLMIFQAMDAAGKDGTIKHVLSGVNPQGCHVSSFKSPSAEELGHEFLWRCAVKLPERGMIGIFNRSYYEEVLAVRVHPEFLSHQRLPKTLIGKHLWDERYEDIRGFEQHLARSGTIVRKFFLNVSKDEQKRRFLKRIEDPDRNWKFSASDATERGHWNDYMAAYEQTIRATATPANPWLVVPADHKWFARLVVVAALIKALEGLDLSFPTVDEDSKKRLHDARRLLDND
jgi:PPK2 family polyphosphate:nucleotide phosphotransferase